MWDKPLNMKELSESDEDLKVGSKYQKISGFIVDLFFLYTCRQIIYLSIDVSEYCEIASSISLMCKWEQIDQVLVFTCYFSLRGR